MSEQERQRPPITVDNYQQVYEYFEDYCNDGKVLSFAYSAINKILHPRISENPQARLDAEHITANNTPHIYIFNHLSKWDYFLFASYLHQKAPGDIGNIRTMGADFNFRGPKISASEIQVGPLVDYIGAVPVFRSQDYPSVDLHPVQEELFNCVARSLVKGHKVAAAPEGKINVTENPMQLLKFRSGIAEVAMRASHMLDSEVAITPIGFCYKRDIHQLKNKGKNARIYVEQSVYATPDMTVPQITEAAREKLQQAAAVAYGLYTTH